MNVPGLRSFLVLAALAVIAPTITVSLIIGLTEKQPVRIGKGAAR